jgi:hypothetical protein
MGLPVGAFAKIVVVTELSLRRSGLIAKVPKLVEMAPAQAEWRTCLGILVVNCTPIMYER